MGRRYGVIMEFDYYIVKIRCGCEFDGMLGPFTEKEAEERVPDMHDDPAYENDSLFIMKVTKGAEVDFC
jgi:hypothetical protein